MIVDAKELIEVTRARAKAESVRGRRLFKWFDDQDMHHHGDKKFLHNQNVQKCEKNLGKTMIPCVCSFSPDRRWFVQYAEKGIRIWDLMDCSKEPNTLLQCSDEYSSTAISTNGSLLFVATSTNFQVLDTETTEVIFTQNVRQVKAGAFSDDCAFLLTWSGDVKVWNLEKKDLASHFDKGDIHPIGKFEERTMAIRGNLLVTASFFNDVAIFNWRTGNCMRKFLESKEFAFCPDRRYLAIASKNEVQVIDLGKDQTNIMNHSKKIQHQQLNSNLISVFGVAISRGGRWLATCQSLHPSKDKFADAIILLDLKTESKLRVFGYDAQDFDTIVSFSRCGTWLISIGGPGTAGSRVTTTKLWRTGLECDFRDRFEKEEKQLSSVPNSPQSKKYVLPETIESLGVPRQSKFIGQAHLLVRLRELLQMDEIVMNFFKGPCGSKSPRVMMLNGESGCGKTELAKLIAEIIHHDVVDTLAQNGKFKKFDMGQLNSRESANTFYGAAPGYEGGKGALYSTIEKCPTAVILLDEFEKAHEEVRNNSCLSIFNGSIQSNCGDAPSISTASATFVLTCNLQVTSLMKGGVINVEDAAFKEAFIDPMRSRLAGKALQFSRPSKDDRNAVVRMELSNIREKFRHKAAQFGQVEFTWESDTVEWLESNAGYDDKIRSLVQGIEELLMKHIFCEDCRDHFDYYSKSGGVHVHLCPSLCNDELIAYFIRMKNGEMLKKIFSQTTGNKSGRHDGSADKNPIQHSKRKSAAPIMEQNNVPNNWNHLSAPGTGLDEVRRKYAPKHAKGKPKLNAKEKRASLVSWMKKNAIRFLFVFAVSSVVLTSFSFCVGWFSLMSALKLSLLIAVVWVSLSLYKVLRNFIVAVIEFVLQHVEKTCLFFVIIAVIVAFFMKEALINIESSESCLTNYQCTNKACGFPEAGSSQKVCCPGGATIGHPINSPFTNYCKGMASGSKCWLDEMCAGGICSDNKFGLQRGTCSGDAKVNMPCTKNEQCENKACGHPYAGATNLICCASGDFTMYAGRDYCTQMPLGAACWSDKMCAGGTCSGNLSGIQKGVCSGDLNVGFPCKYDSECANKKCGRLEAGTKTLHCCPSGEHTLYAGFYYCTKMTSNSVCWSDAMCASGTCKGNAHGVKKGKCT